ncbi:MAG: type 4a pilus biogenesis protein PilO [Patescibacteria group bacterium]|nr:type 4a pilus biogenesis protein PilO [Patescibacteria group bacterium]
METKTTISPQRFNRYYTALEPLLKQPEVRAYTMMIFSFITMSFFGYFAIRPTLTTISTLTKQIDDAKLVDRKLQEKINALSSARMEYENIKPNLGLVWTALPEENKFAPFVQNLEGVATSSGTKITNLSFQTVNLSSLETTTSAAKKEISINFNLTTAGNYASLKDFINKLSYFQRLITIEGLSFSEPKSQDKTGELDLNLIGKTYYVQ